jgi:hypothetical protein
MNALEVQTSLWAVVGGWALDLWHGRQTRTYVDLEFMVMQRHADECRRLLAGLLFYSVWDGVLTYQHNEKAIGAVGADVLVR